jgi:sialate O-acetylesterase
MISEWRRKWAENSPTDPEFPFGFVQLAAWRANYAGAEFPAVRWHQTADMGYVPNALMPVSVSRPQKVTGISIKCIVSKIH